MDLDLLNTLTKYPSIPTFHVLGDKGVMPGEVNAGVPDPASELIITEKVDGTNARIVVTGTDAEDFLIGSRDQWLHAKGDRVYVRDNGIVDVIRGFAANASRLRVPLAIYGEVYGGKINSHKEYTTDGTPGFRVFDVVDLGLSMKETEGMSREQVAAWRDNGGVRWFPFDDVRQFASVIQAMAVPVLARCRPLPTDIAGASDWLSEQAGLHTRASINASGKPEGLVIRDAKNQRRAKLRYDDYARALRGRRA